MKFGFRKCGIGIQSGYIFMLVVSLRICTSKSVFYEIVLLLLLRLDQTYFAIFFWLIKNVFTFEFSFNLLSAIGRFREIRMYLKQDDCSIFGLKYIWLWAKVIMALRYYLQAICIMLNFRTFFFKHKYCVYVFFLIFLCLSIFAP